MAKQFHVDISAARIVNPEQSPDLEKYAHSFYEARKHKVSCCCFMGLYKKDAAQLTEMLNRQMLHMT
jgi:phosphotransacetylase